MGKSWDPINPLLLTLNPFMSRDHCTRGNCLGERGLMCHLVSYLDSYILFIKRQHSCNLVSIINGEIVALNRNEIVSNSIEELTKTNLIITV